MAQYVELISLNRNAKIRVKNSTGNYQQLSTTESCWLRIDGDGAEGTFNRKQLNHHSSIGQYLVLDGNTSPGTYRDLLVTDVSVYLLGLNTAYNGTDKSNVRVKDTSGEPVNLRVDQGTTVYVGGSNDTNRAIARYNRKQLNHHTSIGQWVHAYCKLRALNRSVKVRYWDGDEYKTLSSTENSPWINIGANEKTRKTLNQHSSIGQYIVVDWDD